MPSFFDGFLIICMIFCFCFGISFLIRLLFLWLKEEKIDDAIAPKPTVYLVEQTAKPKRKKSRKKHTDVALKGLMITPEKFKVYKDNDFENL